MGLSPLKWKEMWEIPAPPKSFFYFFLDNLVIFAHANDRQALKSKILGAFLLQKFKELNYGKNNYYYR